MTQRHFTWQQAIDAGWVQTADGKVFHVR